MRKATMAIMTAAIPALLPLAGCIQTKSTVDVKPIETKSTVDVNINLSGRLELVITDARHDLEQITGEKAARTVRPEDIGLPPAPPANDKTGASFLIPNRDSIALLADFAAPQPRPFARDDDVKAAMAARHAQVRALLDAKVVGEAHSGLLAARGALDPAQQAIVAAENKDRQELYTLEAAKKHTTVDQVALGYYLARLGYAKKGDWVERFNKTTNAWEWIQWQG